MLKKKKIIIFLSAGAMLLTLFITRQAFAASEQFRDWRLIYSSQCECYQWRELLIIVLPFASNGQKGEEVEGQYRHPDLAGDSHTLGACDAGVCVINVLFTDFPMERCQSATWATLVDHGDLPDFKIFEHNFTLKRQENGFVATFVVVNESDRLTASRYNLTLDCSRFPPNPFE